jgi:Putative metal-binding motif/Secretion system C-terminal sorting domain
LVDDGLPCLVTWYRDLDGDGVGRTNWTKLSCIQPEGFVLTAGDCNDQEPTIYPGAPELPDGKDNNCNGLVDDGLSCLITWYRDVDGDGHGRNSWTRQSCLQPSGFVDKVGDCRDLDATVYPGAPELCDGKDNDCDGQRDELCGSLITAVSPKVALEVEEISSLRVSIWPNPAVTVLNVTLDAAEPGKKVEIVLSGSDGRNLQSQTVIPDQRGQRIQLNVRGLAPGYYLLRAQQGTLYEVKKVLVTR